MALFKPCSYDYSKFRGMDLFFSNGVGFIGALIRFGQTPKPESITNRKEPNHEGWDYDDRGRHFAAEVGPKGATRNSFDKYRGKYNQIVRMFRWKGYDDPIKREKALTRLATWLQEKQDCGYDAFGAAKSSSWVRKYLSWIPFLKQDPKKPFCSEYCYAFGLEDGMPYPEKWKKQAPNPLEACQFLESCLEFYEIKDFKTIKV
jgi:hypothetical protein